LKYGGAVGTVRDLPKNSRQLDERTRIRITLVDKDLGRWSASTRTIQLVPSNSVRAIFAMRTLATHRVESARRGQGPDILFVAISVMAE